MATDVERLVVQLSADQRKFNKQLRALSGKTSKATRGVEKRFDLMSRRVSNSSGIAAASLTRLFTAVGAGFSTREITRYADAWTEAGNKIAAASQVAGLQARSLEELNELANENRGGITETVDLYSRLLRSSKGVAESEEEVARATGIAIKAFKAGGASATEFQAGVLQLGQALGSGFLQGDELRSLRENAPLIAQAIAKEFETTIGGLKKLGAEGQLTSDRVFKAILSSQTEIESAFAKTNSTIADGFTRLGNSLTEYIGAADKSFEVTQKVVASLNFLADNIDKAAIAAAVLGARIGAGGLSSLFASLAGQARFAAAGMAGATASTVALRGALALLGGPVGLIVAGVAALAVAVNSLPDSERALELALDEVTVAMGDQIKQINQLLALQPGANTMTLASAQAKLQEAQAIYASLEARQQEIQQLILSSEAYQQTLSAIGQYQSALNAIASPGTDLDQIPARLRDAYEQAEAGLAQALNIQNQLLSKTSATKDEIDVARQKVESWQQAISATRGGMVTLNGDIIQGVNLSDALSKNVDAINFSGAIKGATELAQRLGVSLSLARQIAAAAGSSNVGDEVFDPRSDRFNPNAQRGANREAELQRIRDENARIDAEIASRVNSASRSSGGSGGGSSASPANTAAQNEFNAALQEAERLIEANLTAEERLAVAVSKNVALLPALAESIKAEASARGAVISGADAELQAKAQIELANDRLIDQAPTLQNELRDTFKSASREILNGANAVDVLRNKLQDLLLDGALDALFKRGSGGGALGGLFGGGGGFLSGLFGGFRANGGPVSSSKAYVVGERGPELFVPSSNGAIVPNGGAKGAGARGSQNVNIRILAPEGFTAEDIGQIAAGVSVQVVNENNKKVPAMVADAQRRA